ncbi:hypothetical protein [Microbacterium sp. oral taxon 186]|nr:hypothetical protein [Microbacterium sp. oral taxon 186]
MDTAMRFAIAALPHIFPQLADPVSLDAVRHWVDADSQAQLRLRLEEEFDGFAVAVPFRHRIAYPEIWARTRIALWSSVVLPTSPLRSAIRTTDAILIDSPREQLYSAEPSVVSKDILRRGRRTKSDEWTRWVLAHLGALPGEDSVVDYFSRLPVPAFTAMITLEGTQT